MRGRYFQFFGASCFTVLLIGLAYWGYRDFFITNFFIYSLLFGLLYTFYRFSGHKDKHVIGWLIFAMALRSVLLLAMPHLSDDYYRFIWDGNLALCGFNPYQYTPEEILPRLLDRSPDYFLTLFNHLKSPNYFSVYPPTNQLIFVLGSWVGGENISLNVFFLRLVLIAFEGGVLVMLWKIAKLTGVNTRQILLYGLNPLVIMEITGNLHFEGVMLFFLLLGFYSFLKSKKSVG
jgi:alpha-1,6-mannosyltransferase